MEERGEWGRGKGEQGRGRERGRGGRGALKKELGSPRIFNEAFYLKDLLLLKDQLKKERGKIFKQTKVLKKNENNINISSQSEKKILRIPRIIVYQLRIIIFQLKW